MFWLWLALTGCIMITNRSRPGPQPKSNIAKGGSPDAL
jgi:hypothetical protein